MKIGNGFPFFKKRSLASLLETCVRPCAASLRRVVLDEANTFPGIFPRLRAAIGAKRRILLSRSSELAESKSGVVCDLPWLLQNPGRLLRH